MAEQNTFENTPKGAEIYDILYSNLPTIDAGGDVSEEHIWKCVNELLDKFINNKELLEEYTNFLYKNGYIDSDALTEKPLAVDRFILATK